MCMSRCVYSFEHAFLNMYTCANREILPHNNQTHLRMYTEEEKNVCMIRFFVRRTQQTVSTNANHLTYMYQKQK